MQVVKESLYKKDNRSEIYAELEIAEIICCEASSIENAFIHVSNTLSECQNCGMIKA